MSTIFSVLSNCHQVVVTGPFSESTRMRSGNYGKSLLSHCSIIVRKRETTTRRAAETATTTRIGAASTLQTEMLTRPYGPTPGAEHTLCRRIIETPCTPSDQDFPLNFTSSFLYTEWKSLHPHHAVRPRFRRTRDRAAFPITECFLSQRFAFRKRG